jgi:hypothetical protein
MELGVVVFEQAGLHTNWAIIKKSRGVKIAAVLVFTQRADQLSFSTLTCQSFIPESGGTCMLNWESKILSICQPAHGSKTHHHI